MAGVELYSLVRMNLIDQLQGQYAPLGVAATFTSGRGREETVQELVAFLYEFIREDAEMVRALDRALKVRYGAD